MADDLNDSVDDSRIEPEPSSSTSDRDFSDATTTDQQSIPIHLCTSSDEDATLAFFPMRTIDEHPHDRLSSVSKNNIDGRVRCEIKDSIIHGREQTAEGIPIDYHLLWESSPAPTETYRKDYYLYKSNGKLFLIPVQVVHMRTVIEPKDSGQESKGFLSPVSHSGNRQNEGKFVNFKMEEGNSADPFRVSEKPIEIATLEQTIEEYQMNLEEVIKAALSLHGTAPTDLATNSAALLNQAKAAAAVSELAPIFKKGRVHKTSSILQQLPDKSPESVVEALKSCAFLVQGNWVGQGKIFFKESPSGKVFPLRIAYDYLLSLFVKSNTVDVSAAGKKLKLRADMMNHILNMFAAHVKGSGTRWRFNHETDKEFLRTHADLVRSQEKNWEDYRSELEKQIDEWYANASKPKESSENIAVKENTAKDASLKETSEEAKGTGKRKTTEDGGVAAKKQAGAVGTGRGGAVIPAGGGRGGRGRGRGGFRGR